MCGVRGQTPKLTFRKRAAFTAMKDGRRMERDTEPVKKLIKPCVMSC